MQLFDDLGQHGDSILAALAVEDRDLVSLEVDVLDSQAEALHQAQDPDIAYVHPPVVTHL